MAGYDFTKTCPECNNEMSCYGETRGYCPGESGTCLHCGHWFCPSTGKLTPDELRQRRNDNEDVLREELTEIWEDATPEEIQAFLDKYTNDAAFCPHRHIEAARDKYMENVEMYDVDVVLNEIKEWKELLKEAA